LNNQNLTIQNTYRFSVLDCYSGTPSVACGNVYVNKKSIVKSKEWKSRRKKVNVQTGCIKREVAKKGKKVT